MTLASLLAGAVLMAAAPSGSGLYQGEIGEGGADSEGNVRRAFDVVLLLETGKTGDLQGRYFYWSQRKDIRVDGTLTDGSLTLTEYGEKGGAASGRFELRPTKERDGWVGTWRGNTKRAAIPVRLVRVGPPEGAELERWRARTVSHPEKLSGSDWSIEWHASPVSASIRLPFLRGYPDAAIENKVNAELEKQLAQLGCEKNKGEWETASQVTFAARDIFSVSIHSSYFCGGAYPTNDADSSITFDLKTGNPVPFESLFAAKKKTVLRALLPGHLAAETTVPIDGECPTKWSVDEAADWTMQYVVEPGGIRLGPTFPHVLEACAFRDRAPIARLLPLAAKNGILTRLRE